MMYVVKKDGTKEDFDVQKIVRAVNKSASRIMYKFKEDEVESVSYTHLSYCVCSRKING